MEILGKFLSDGLITPFIHDDDAGYDVTIVKLRIKDSENLVQEVQEELKKVN